jgi:hypothetical protein
MFADIYGYKVIIYQLIEHKKIQGSAFWDILDFAEFVYAVKIKNL